MKSAVLLAIVLSTAWAAACSSGSSTPPAVDAPAPTVDAMKPSGSGAAFGSACTTVSDTSTECASGVCTNSFNMFPTPVCSQKCTVLGGSDPTCPNGSMGTKCNQQGYCRP